MRRLLRLLVLFLASAAIVAVLLAATTSPSYPRLLLLFDPPHAHSPKLIFLLAGQSNMAGRGGISPDGRSWNPDSAPLPPSCRPSPRLLRLSAARRWVPAAAPLHADIDAAKTCGVGPGMPFANAVLSSCTDSVVVGLVPCAVGGSRIGMWGKGERLYEAAVGRARAAVGGGGGSIAALLWFQGESDTVQLEDAEAYGRRMETLVRDFRQDLRLPWLLVIQVALASGEGNYTDIVREAQKKINLPNVILVDAMGLPLRDDQLHLTTEAQVRLGSMLAHAYLNFNSSRDSRL